MTEHEKSFARSLSRAQRLTLVLGYPALAYAIGHYIVLLVQHHDSMARSTGLLIVFDIAVLVQIHRDVIKARGDD